jgi:UDP-glucose 4-epimerase
MNQVMQNQPMTIFGDGSQTRAFSHIDDVAPLIASAPLICAARNQVFNIGADTPYTVLQLAEEVASAFAMPMNVIHLPPRNEVVHAFSDHSKARSAFGHSVPIDLRSGIRRMAQWVKRRGPARPVTFSNLELTKNLPLSWQEVSSDNCQARSTSLVTRG